MANMNGMNHVGFRKRLWAIVVLSGLVVLVPFLGLPSGMFIAFQVIFGGLSGTLTLLCLRSLYRVYVDVVEPHTDGTGPIADKEINEEAGDGQASA